MKKTKVKKLRVYSLDTLKKPTAKYEKFGDWIGVEIECFFPNSSFVTRQTWYNTPLHENPFDCLKRRLRALKIPRLTLGIDGSIHAPTGSFGVEFKILCNRDNMSNLQTLCDFIRTHNGGVNDSCGLHVHFDSRGMLPSYKKKVTKNFESALPFLTKMVPQSRALSSWCIPRVSRDKYSAFHMDTPYRTIEVRLHSGTLNYEKISNWITIIMRVARSNILREKKPTDIDDFFKAIRLDEKMQKYYLERSSRFNPEFVKANKKAA